MNNTKIEIPYALFCREVRAQTEENSIGYIGQDLPNVNIFIDCIYLNGVLPCHYLTVKKLIRSCLVGIRFPKKYSDEMSCEVKSDAYFKVPIEEAIKTFNFIEFYSDKNTRDFPDEEEN